MLKILNENNEVIGYLASSADIPKWLIYYKNQCQLDIDVCKKAGNYTGRDIVKVTQHRNGFAFQGVFTEYVYFAEIEPWTPEEQP